MVYRFSRKVSLIHAPYHSLSSCLTDPRTLVLFDIVTHSCILLVSSFRRLDNGSQLCHLLYRERVSAGCDSRMTFWPLCGTRKIILLTAEYVTSILYTEYAPEISIADVLNCVGTYIGLLAPSNLTHEKLTSFQSGAVSDFRTAATVQARDHCDVRSWPKSYLVTQAWKVSAGKCRTQLSKVDHCKEVLPIYYMHALIGFFNVTCSIHQVLVISAVFCRPCRQSWPFRTTKSQVRGWLASCTSSNPFFRVYCMLHSIRFLLVTLNWYSITQHCRWNLRNCSNCSIA